MQDKDLHDDNLSALYARTRAAEHTPDIDPAIEAAILAAAHAPAAQQPSPRRFLPLASAAVLVLAVGVLFRYTNTPAPVAVTAAPQAVKSERLQDQELAAGASFGAAAQISEHSEALGRAVRISMEQAPAEARPNKELDRYAEKMLELNAIADSRGGLALPAAAPPPAHDLAKRPQPALESTQDPRLQPVRALLASGEKTKAREALEKLLIDHPDIQVDEALRIALELPPPEAQTSE